MKSFEKNLKQRHKQTHTRSTLHETLEHVTDLLREADALLEEAKKTADPEVLKKKVGVLKYRHKELRDRVGR